MAYIGKSPVIGNFVKLDAITAVNGQAAYTMQNGGSNFTDYESVNQFLVSLNGTIQAPTDSFTVSGSTLTFASNLSTGDVIDFIVVFGNSLSAGTPTDATVSKSKLATDVPLAIWQSTIQTSNFTASSNKGYFIDTSSGAFEVDLPTSPSFGDVIEFVDFSRSFATNALTLDQGSNKFQGNTSPKPQYNTNGQSVRVVYSGTSQGWIPTSDDDVSFETAPYTIDFLVIGGGGSGAKEISGGAGAGGGGAGGYRTSTQSISSTGTTITVTVGDGGASQTSTRTNGNSGSNSSISGSGLTTITSAGGGYGASYPNNGGDGGSGGGGGGAATTSGGSGNTPSTTPSQGNDGGGQTSTAAGGGGGGGAGAVGSSTSSSDSANGGDGLASSITGSSVTRAGGGGAGAKSPNSIGTGGSGGGGNGGANGSTVGVDGTANTGSGGGGGGVSSGSASNSGAGGKGVVILSIPTIHYSGTTSGSPTISTTSDGEEKTILTFTGSGSYTT